MLEYFLFVDNTGAPAAYCASVVEAMERFLPTAASTGFWAVHPGVLATKVGYFGVKSAKVGLGPGGHQTC